MPRTKKNRRFKIGAAVLVTLGLWCAAAGLIVFVRPGVWWAEVPVVTIVLLAVWFTATLVSKRARWGAGVAALTIGLLILRRLDWLDFLTGGLLLLVVGLITLIN